MKQVAVTVTANNEVMPGVYLMWLETPHIASTALPGQFVMVRCGEETLLRRPLSIHQLAGKDRLALLFAVLGKGTHWLSQRQTGDSIDLLGPLGNSYQIHSGSRHLLLLAGGIGIAPLRFLAEDAAGKGYAVTLLHGAHSEYQLYPEHLLPPDIEIVSSTEDGSIGKKGRVTDLLPDFVDWADQVFACGPVAMYHGMYARREELLGGKPVQISLEARMGCGLGICYGCTVKTVTGLKQVCRDGPVFELDDIRWDEPGLLVP